MNEDQIKELYKQLTGAGYELDDDKTFSEDFKNDESFRKQIHGYMTEDKLTDKDYNSWNSQYAVQQPTQNAQQKQAVNNNVQAPAPVKEHVKGLAGIVSSKYDANMNYVDADGKEYKGSDLISGIESNISNIYNQGYKMLAQGRSLDEVANDIASATGLDKQRIIDAYTSSGDVDNATNEYNAYVQKMKEQYADNQQAEMSKLWEKALAEWDDSLNAQKERMDKFNASAESLPYKRQLIDERKQTLYEADKNNVTTNKYWLPVYTANGHEYGIDIDTKQFTAPILETINKEIDNDITNEIKSDISYKFSPNKEGYLEVQKDKYRDYNIEDIKSRVLEYFDKYQKKAVQEKAIKAAMDIQANNEQGVAVDVNQVAKDAVNAARTDLIARTELMIEKRLTPKTKTDAVIGFALENSIPGKVLRGLTWSGGTNELYEYMANRYRQENYNGWDTAIEGTVSFAADMPFFGVSGSFSAKTVSKMFSEGVEHLVMQGVSKANARALISAYLGTSVGRNIIARKALQGAIGSGLNMFYYDMMSGAAEQFAQKRFAPGENIKDSFLGAITMAPIGVMGEFTKPLIGSLSGLTKGVARVGEFGLETSLFAGGGWFTKWVLGAYDQPQYLPDGSANPNYTEFKPWEDWVEAAKSLAGMKVASLLHGKQAFKEMFSLKESETNPLGFNKAEHSELTDTPEGKALLKIINGGEQTGLDEAFINFVNCPTISYVTKQKISKLLTGSVIDQMPIPTHTTYDGKVVTIYGSDMRPYAKEVLDSEKDAKARSEELNKTYASDRAKLRLGKLMENPDAPFTTTNENGEQKPLQVRNPLTGEMEDANLTNGDVARMHEDGTFHLATVKGADGKDQKVFITNGEIATDDKGSIDRVNSSESIVYIGSDGQPKVTTPDKISETQNVSLEEYVYSQQEERRQPIDNLMQAKGRAVKEDQAKVKQALNQQNQKALDEQVAGYDKEAWHPTTPKKAKGKPEVYKDETVEPWETSADGSRLQYRYSQRNKDGAVSHVYTDGVGRAYSKQAGLADKAGSRAIHETYKGTSYTDDDGEKMEYQGTFVDSEGREYVKYGSKDNYINLYLDDANDKGFLDSKLNKGEEVKTEPEATTETAVPEETIVLTPDFERGAVLRDNEGNLYRIEERLDDGSYDTVRVDKDGRVIADTEEVLDGKAFIERGIVDAKVEPVKKAAPEPVAETTKPVATEETATTPAEEAKPEPIKTPQQQQYEAVSKMLRGDKKKVGEKVDKAIADTEKEIAELEKKIDEVDIDMRHPEKSQAQIDKLVSQRDALYQELEGWNAVKAEHERPEQPVETPKPDVPKEAPKVEEPKVEASKAVETPAPAEEPTPVEEPKVETPVIKPTAKKVKVDRPMTIEEIEVSDKLTERQKANAIAQRKRAQFVIDLAHKYNIPVVSVDGYFTNRAEGAFNGSQRVIYINADMTPEQLRMNVASIIGHELKHSLDTGDNKVLYNNLVDYAKGTKEFENFIANELAIKVGVGKDAKVVKGWKSLQDAINAKKAEYEGDFTAGKEDDMALDEIMSDFFGSKILGNEDYVRRMMESQPKTVKAVRMMYDYVRDMLNALRGKENEPHYVELQKMADMLEHALEVNTQAAVIKESKGTDIKYDKNGEIISYKNAEGNTVIIRNKENIADIDDAAATDDKADDLGNRVLHSYGTEPELFTKIKEFADGKFAEELGWKPEEVNAIAEETTKLISAIHDYISGDENYDAFASLKPTIRVDWRDGVERPIVSWNRGNVEYKYDMSADTFCINNEALEDILASKTMADIMMHIAKATKKGYTSDDYLRLYETLRDSGFVVPCKGCFDAAARFKMLPSVSQKFVQEVNEVIAERVKNPKKFDDSVRELPQGEKERTVQGFPNVAATKSVAIRIGVAGDQLTKPISWTQLMSAEGQTKALTDWGGIFRAWQKTGAGRPKDKLKPEPYTGEIISSVSTIIAPYGDSTPSFRQMEVNVGTGLRRNSHSEFRPVLAVDEMQFMRDAWLKKLCVFKYMKELDDVRLFGNLGVKFNMSGFAAWEKDGVAAGLDANGNYAMAEESVGGREFPYYLYNGKRYYQGEPGWTEARTFGETHYDGMKGFEEAKKHINKDCSLSTVVFSVPHLLKVLVDIPTPSDPRGTWGSAIPFHASGATEHQLALQGLGRARAIDSKVGGAHDFFKEAFTDYNKGVTNFEQVQNDRFGKGWKSIKGKKEGQDLEGNKMNLGGSAVCRNDELGITYFTSPKTYKEFGGTEKFDVKGEFYTLDSEGGKIAHPIHVDYNDKVRELGGDYAYKDAADYYRDELRKIGFLPRFEFEIPEDIFLDICSIVIDPYTGEPLDPHHPKLGWKGEGHGYSPCDAESYYGLFCDYGMTDPATGKLSPHRPVLDGETAPDAFEKALPKNYGEIIAEGLERYTSRRNVEQSKTDDAIVEYCKRTIADGKATIKEVEKILRKNGFTREQIAALKSQQTGNVRLSKGNAVTYDDVYTKPEPTGKSPAEYAKEIADWRDNVNQADEVRRQGEDIRFSKRVKADPVETIDCYKLMRLGEDGEVYPLYIDRDAEPILRNTWYDGDVPNIEALKAYKLEDESRHTLDNGQPYTNGMALLLDKEGNVLDSKPIVRTYGYKDDEGKTKSGLIKGIPSKEMVDGLEVGQRWMTITIDANGEYSYHNVGINGAEGTSTYALRPGWHAAMLPSMEQIGKGKNRNLRDDSFVWVRGKLAAEHKFVKGDEGMTSAGDMPLKMPEDGYYEFMTNPKQGAEKKAKAKAEAEGREYHGNNWYVSGAFMPEEIISDAEARRVIDEHNKKYGTQVPYDYERESGKVFDGKQLVDKDPTDPTTPDGGGGGSRPDVLYSKSNDSRTISERSKDWVKYRRENGIPENGKVDINKVGELFNRYNGDETLGALFNRVSDTIKNRGIEFSFTDDIADGIAGQSGKLAGVPVVQYKKDSFSFDGRSDQTKAKILLHEMIHQVATGLQNRYNRHSADGLTDVEKACCAEFEKIYQAVKQLGGDFYGLKSSAEMVAELANPKFREWLSRQEYSTETEVKPRNLLQWCLDNLRNMFSDTTKATPEGGRRNALEGLAETFDNLMTEEIGNEITVGNTLYDGEEVRYSKGNEYSYTGSEDLSGEGWFSSFARGDYSLDYLQGKVNEYRNRLADEIERGRDESWLRSLREHLSKLENALEARKKWDVQKETIKINLDNFGLKLGEPVGIEKAKDVFDSVNTNKDMKKLFDKVYKQAKKLGVKFRVEDTYYAGNYSGLYRYEQNDIAINDMFFTDDFLLMDRPAEIILHEMIHGVTSRALLIGRYANSGSYYEQALRRKYAPLLTPEINELWQEIHSLYVQSKKRNPYAYGSKNEQEFIAELANPTFRRKIQADTIWKKVVNAIAKFFGKTTKNAEETNTLDELTTLLDKALTSWSRKQGNAFEKVYNGESFDALEQGGDMRFSKSQTKSESFKNWFGDWEKDPENASKVVDEKGEPLVVYRGDSRGRTILDNEAEFFIESPYAAASYSNGDVPEYAVYLNIKKPLDLRHSDNARFNGMRIADTDKRVIQIYKDALNAMPEDWTLDVWGDKWTKQQVIANIFSNYHGIEVIEDRMKSLAWEPLVKYAKENGYDGIISTDQSADLYEEYVPSYITFSPTQIKSATANNGNFDRNNPDIRYSRSISNSDPFYSNAAKAVEGIKQEKATGEQWLNMLKKNGGLKAEEDKWMGLSDWLRDKKSITKEEVQKFIAENAIKIEEVKYGQNVRKTFLEPTMAQKRNNENEFVSNYDNGFHIRKESNGKYSAWDDYGGEPVEFDTFEEAERYTGETLAQLWGDAGIEGEPEVGEKPINDVRERYQTEGLKNNKEIALTIPAIEPYHGLSPEIHFDDEYTGGKAVAWIRFGEATEVPGEIEFNAQKKVSKQKKQAYNDEYERLLKKYDVADEMELDAVASEEDWDELKRLEEEYYNSFPDVNLLKQKGGRVLVVDEVQSQRHEDAREVVGKDENGKPIRRGYIGNRNAVRENFANVDSELREKYGITGFPEDVDAAYKEIMSADDYNKWKEAQGKWIEVRNKVPDAPFRTNWQELAMKRMLRYAAENGYDKIAWTTGERQSDRYGISKMVDEIVITEDYSEGGGVYDVVANKEGEAVLENNGKTREEVAQIIGKELAQKAFDNMENGEAVLSGQSLKIGGKGMKAFYDGILPQFMDKYGKKWGVKTYDISLDLPNEADRVMHGIDVTPEMKESVMQGQMLFSRSNNYSDLIGEAASNHDMARVTRLAKSVLKQSEKYKKDSEEYKAMVKAVSDYFTSAINLEWMDAIGKQKLARMLRLFPHQSGATQEKMLTQAEGLVRDLEVRHLENSVTRLLQLKVQGKNGTGIPVGKTVDDDTRQVFGIIRELNGTAKATEFDDEVHDLGSQLWHARRDAKTAEADYRSAVDELGYNAPETRKLENEWLEAQSKIEDLKNQYNELRGKQTAVRGDVKAQRPADLDDEIATLLNKEGDLDENEERRLTALQVLRPLAEAEAYDGKGTDENLGLTGIEEQTSKLSAKIRELNKEFTGASEQRKAEIREEKKLLKSKIDGLEVAANQVKSRQAQAYREAEAQLKSIIEGGRESLKKQVQAEKDRGKEIIQKSIHDLHPVESFDRREKNHGVPQNLDKLNEKKFPTASYIITGILKSFDYMCSKVSRNLSQEGFLYDHFMYGNDGAMAAEENYIARKRKATQTFDDMCQKIFGMNFDKAGEEFNRMDKNTVRLEYTTERPDPENEGQTIEVKDYINLTQANLMYLYQVNKQDDGKMKLYAMGFTEETLAKAFEELDPKCRQFADWMQNEWYPKMREEMNELHKEIFFTSMAKIDNYCPIKISKNKIVGKNDSVNGMPQTDQASTKNGSLINRTVNCKSIELATSAFEVLREHTIENIEWLSYTRFRKDMDYVLNSPTFKARMNANNQGSYEDFKTSANIAMRRYLPAGGKADTAVAKIMAGGTATAIGFHNWTAIKQLLSYPCFYAYSQHPAYLARITKNAFTPASNLKWVRENSPLLLDRLESGLAGATDLERELMRLGDGAYGKFIEQVSKFGMAANKFVDYLTCAAGARAIYEFELPRLKEMYMQGGGSEEVASQKAHTMALRKAEIAFNQTQQSSLPAFKAQTQVDRGIGDRYLSLFKTSPAGQSRKSVLGALDIMKGASDFEGLVKRRMEMTGEDEATARKRTNNSMRKAAMQFAINGWLAKEIWDKSAGVPGMVTNAILKMVGLGGLGWIGSQALDNDPDADDGEKMWETIVRWLSYPIQGTVLGDFLHDGVAGSFGYNPFSIMQRSMYTDTFELIKKVSDKDDTANWGKLIGTATKMGVVLGMHLDPEVIANVVIVANNVMSNGIEEDLAINVALLLMMPKEARRDAAQIYHWKGSPMEYAKAMALAHREMQDIPMNSEWLKDKSALINATTRALASLKKQDQKSIKAHLKEWEEIQCSNEENDNYEKVENNLKSYNKAMKETNTKPMESAQTLSEIDGHNPKWNAIASLSRQMKWAREAIDAELKKEDTNTDEVNNLMRKVVNMKREILDIDNGGKFDINEISEREGQASQQREMRNNKISFEDLKQDYVNHGYTDANSWKNFDDYFKWKKTHNGQ